MAADIDRLRAIAQDIRDAAGKTQGGTEQGAEDIERLTRQLAAVVRGSRTGEGAVRDLDYAVRALRDTSEEFSSIARAIDDFIIRAGE